MFNEEELEALRSMTTLFDMIENLRPLWYRKKGTLKLLRDKLNQEIAYPEINEDSILDNYETKRRTNENRITKTHMLALRPHMGAKKPRCEAMA